MRVPLSWLKDYVDIGIGVDELAERLTASGTEVTGIDRVGEGLDSIIACEILKVEDHPNADKLSVCTVTDGSGELRIVCGAPNVAVGNKVPLAKAGVVLPNGMKIRKASIRGEKSAGMLCAEDELGLSQDHSGLMQLGGDVKPGTSLAEVVGVDAVLEIDVTWNRPDCLSIIGIAREVAALLGADLKLPAVDFEETGEAIEGLVSVRVEDPDGCPRYTARVLSDIKLGPSPLWMRKRLSLCGLRPIVNIVDVTNYVMLECGHPLHAFDYTLLKDGEIVVRRVRKGETMATLDGVARELTDDMLVIADSSRPVALAGIMGGAGSEIGDDTAAVLLESACFDRADIKRTSAALGLHTESSRRFERGVNIETVDWASRRAARLMVGCAGATVANGVVDVFPSEPGEKIVSCRYQHARNLLGVEISNGEMAHIFESLELKVKSDDGEACAVIVPGFRYDIEIEADLIEEVARMHGLAGIESPAPHGRIVPGVSDLPTRKTKACRDAMIGLGLTEVVNYSFLSESLLNLFGGDAVSSVTGGALSESSRVVLPNPVSADYAVLRNSLVPQMVETLGRNLARQVGEAALFEMGRVFSTDGTIKEGDHICVGLMGPVGRPLMDKRRPVDSEEMFLWVKGVIESLCSGLRVPNGAVEFHDCAQSFCEAGWSNEISIGGDRCGFAGLLRKDIREHWRMAFPVAVAEFEWSILSEAILAEVELKPPPAYPGVARDMAVVVSDDITDGKIREIIAQNAPEELTDITLFDIFRSEGIGTGKKSMAYSLTYRSSERTLTDDDANGYHDAIKCALRSKLNADIREG